MENGFREKKVASPCHSSSVLYPYIWIYSSHHIYTYRGVFRNRKPRFDRNAGSENK